MISLDRLHRMGAIIEKRKGDGYYQTAPKFLIVYEDQIVTMITPGTPSNPKWTIEGGDRGDELGAEKTDKNVFRAFKEVV